MSRNPCLGNQLWWQEVKRNKTILNDPIVSDGKHAGKVPVEITIPPGYQMAPESPRGRETTDPVKPTPPESRFEYAQKAAIQAAMPPRQEVKIDTFVNGKMPPPGLRPVLRDSNGLEVIEAIKGYIPPDQVSLMPKKAATPQKPYAPLRGPLTLQDLGELEHEADVRGGSIIPLEWRI